MLPTVVTTWLFNRSYRPRSTLTTSSISILSIHRFRGRGDAPWARGQEELTMRHVLSLAAIGTNGSDGSFVHRSFRVKVPPPPRRLRLRHAQTPGLAGSCSETCRNLCPRIVNASPINNPSFRQSCFFLPQSQGFVAGLRAAVHLMVIIFRPRKRFSESLTP